MKKTNRLTPRRRLWARAAVRAAITRAPIPHSVASMAPGAAPRARELSFRRAVGDRFGTIMGKILRMCLETVDDGITPAVDR